MSAATRVLVVGGMSVLMFGFLLGIAMAAARSKAPQAPRYLFAVHLAAIVQGGILLALTVAVSFSSLSPNLETAAACVLLVGVALFDLGLATNWLQDVQDGFGEKSIGNKVSAVGTPLVLIGTGVLFYGVLTGI